MDRVGLFGVTVSKDDSYFGNLVTPHGKADLP